MVAVTTLAGAPSSAARFDNPKLTHLRTSSPQTKALFEYAARVSAIAHELMNRLEASDVIVQVQSSDEKVAGCSYWLKFIGSSHLARFVLINLPRRASPCEGVPLLAHELAHALEIADDAEARDSRSVARLFSRIGWQAGDGAFETDGARAVEASVRWEIASATPRSPNDTKNGGNP